MSKPEEEPCWASEATPFAGASTFHTGANQLESDGDIGGLLLGEFNLGQAGGCALEWNGLSWLKKGEQVLIVPQRESPA